MPDPDLLVAVDQGSSATKALVVDAVGAVVAQASVPIGAAYPRPGWVEQSGSEILESVRSAVQGCLAGLDPARVLAVGFSTQRESILLWDAATGAPVGPLISWQDQRTTPLCDELVAAGHGPSVLELTGLPLDPNFSATRARWLLDQADPDRRRSAQGGLRLGTVDSWLLTMVTGEHIIEVGNASRSQLMNVHTRAWDPDLLQLFGVPPAVLPRIVSSVGPFPGVRGLDPLRDGTPVGAVMGDSHAALYAHAGWVPGTVKATYGTGSSVMGLRRSGPGVLGGGLCLTVAWEDDAAEYAVEGNIRSSGATIAWLARVFDTTPERLAELAKQAGGSEGVSLVPAFSGLGAPYWDGAASGLLTGLTFGTGLPQLARAGLESVAHQVEDVVEAMSREVGAVEVLLTDGGAASNDQLMQLQADLGGRLVRRATARDLSALGVAHLAGRALGVWTPEDLLARRGTSEDFRSMWTAAERTTARAAWRGAVAKARHVEPPDAGPAETTST